MALNFASPLRQDVGSINRDEPVSNRRARLFRRRQIGYTRGPAILERLASKHMQSDDMIAAPAKNLRREKAKTPAAQAPSPMSSASSAASRMIDSDSRDLVDHLVDDWAAERPDLDTGAMPVIGRFIMIGRALEARTNAALRPFDLNYSDFDVLATLRRSGSPCELTPKQLMGSVLLTSGAMTALLDRLERRGLVARGRAPSDGRVKTARLTPAGRALIDRAVVARFADATAAAELLPPDPGLDLAAMLRAFVAELGDNRRGEAE